VILEIHSNINGGLQEHISARYVQKFITYGETWTSLSISSINLVRGPTTDLSLSKHTFNVASAGMKRLWIMLWGTTGSWCKKVNPVKP